jgi:hypothetical protein
MSTSVANWRIVLFWTKVGVACIGISLPFMSPSTVVVGGLVGLMLMVGLLSVVICICLTPGFPDILLLLVAAVLSPYSDVECIC